MNTNRFNNKNIKRFAIAAGTTAGALFLTAGIVAGIGNNGSKKADVAQAPAAPQATVVVDQPAASPSVVEESAPAAIATSNESTKSLPSKSTASTKKQTNRKSAATGTNVVVSDPTITDAAQAPSTTVAPQVSNSEAPAASAPAAQSADQQQAAAVAEPAPTNSATSSVSIPKWTYTNDFGSKINAVDLTKTTTVTVPKLCIPGVTC